VAGTLDGGSPPANAGGDLQPSFGGELSAVHGFATAGFEAVSQEFARNMTERGDIGAAFSAVVDGKVAVDLWGGLADRPRELAWRHDTIAGIYSGAKGFVAVCLLLLIERRQLHLDKPVSFYWPEFAANGKGRILVRDVVSHQAGLPGLTTPVTAEEATDGPRMARLLAGQPALEEPGARLRYHALTFGWLCGELIRRIDGRGVGRFFSEEVAAPLGLSAWIGLPEEHEERVAFLERGPGFGSHARTSGGTGADDRVAWSIWENPPRFSVEPLPANSRFWRAGEVPAGNGVASARSVARLYGCLARGGEIDDVRLLSPEIIDLGVTCLARGVEPLLDKPMAYGVGFQLQTDGAPFGPADIAFGHNGAGGSVHGAWPKLRTGFSYVTNTLREFDGIDPRSASLLRALNDCLMAGATGNNGL
jgi:CubicO group peptidase (beta-lactamase class C family)